MTHPARFAGTIVLAATLIAPVLFPSEAPAVPPVEVTTCGQDVHARRAFLSNDLICPGSHTALILSGGTVLNLNGFTISTDDDGRGILCGGGTKCKIVGPGTITNNGRQGIVASAIKLENVSVINNTSDGVEAFEGGRGRIVMKSSTVTGNSRDGLRAMRKIKVKDSNVSGNSRGGIVAGLSHDGSFISDKGKTLIKNSTVTGNGLTHPDCGSLLTCADISAGTAPRIRAGSSCDTSYNVASGVPGTSWDVCSLD